MIRKCDCGTKYQALVWCHIHGFINHPKPLPRKKKSSLDSLDSPQKGESK